MEGTKSYLKIGSAIEYTGLWLGRSDVVTTKAYDTEKSKGIKYQYRSVTMMVQQKVPARVDGEDVIEIHNVGPRTFKYVTVLDSDPQEDGLNDFQRRVHAGLEITISEHAKACVITYEDGTTDKPVEMDPECMYVSPGITDSALC